MMMIVNRAEIVIIILQRRINYNYNLAADDNNNYNYNAAAADNKNHNNNYPCGRRKGRSVCLNWTPSKFHHLFTVAFSQFFS